MVDSSLDMRRHLPVLGQVALVLCGLVALPPAPSFAAPSPSDASDGRVAFPPPTGQIRCADRLFIEDPALRWVERKVTPAAGMDGLRAAIARSDRRKPTRIKVAAGTYRGQCLYVEDHVRTARAPLWLVADGPVQIDCADGNGQAFGFVHVAYVAIDGFTFGPARGHYGDSGVHVGGKPVRPSDPRSYGRWQPSHHVIVRANTMRNLNRGSDGDGNPDHYESGCCDGAKANQAEWVWFLGNTISRTARHGIDNVGVHHVAMCGNTFTDLVGEGQGVEAKGGSYDVVIEGNRFERVFHRAIMLGGEGSNNNFMWPADFPAEAYGVVARNNVVVDANEGGVTFYGCWSCEASHNSVWFTPGHAGHARDFMRMYPSILEGGSYDEGERRAGGDTSPPHAANDGRGTSAWSCATTCSGTAATRCPSAARAATASPATPTPGRCVIRYRRPRPVQAAAPDLTPRDHPLIRRRRPRRARPARPAIPPPPPPPAPPPLPCPSRSGRQLRRHRTWRNIRRAAARRSTNGPHATPGIRSASRSANASSRSSGGPRPSPDSGARATAASDARSSQRIWSAPPTTCCASPGCASRLPHRPPRRRPVAAAAARAIGHGHGHGHGSRAREPPLRGVSQHPAASSRS